MSAGTALIKEPLDFPGSQAALSLTDLIGRTGMPIFTEEQLVEVVDVTFTADTAERVAVLRDEQGRFFAQRIAQIRPIGPVARAMLKGKP